MAVPMTGRPRWQPGEQAAVEWRSARTRYAVWLSPTVLVGLAVALVVPIAAGHPGKTPSPTPSGRTLFIAACGSCHAFAPARTRGTKGPNLVDEAPSYRDVISQIDEGGDGMPAFGNSLKRAEVQAIAAFVAKASSPSGESADD
jgi:mono/diheme cytochrome c family protein